jgi:hypothetical protein
LKPWTLSARPEGIGYSVRGAFVNARPQVARERIFPVAPQTAEPSPVKDVWLSYGLGFMDPKYEQFLQQAQTCMAEADQARVPEVRQGWLQLAARWLDMIPPDGVRARPEISALEGEVGYRGKHARN